jgi:hypothetical protein
MEALNHQGIAAPTGGVFTYGATHRVLHRLKRLGLGEGPRTVSEAASARLSLPRGGGKSGSRMVAWVQQITAKQTKSFDPS